jgi:predicted nucleic acid-binding protein
MVALLLKETRFEDISEILTLGASSHAQLLTESSNAIAQARKNGRVDEEGARKMVESMLELVRSSSITIHTDQDLIEDAFRIAVDYDLTIYDSVFLALAQKLRGPLLSRDRKQIEAARKLGIEIFRHLRPRHKKHINHKRNNR